MPEISELRTLIRDRQQKEKLGTITHEVCLDPDLVVEYHDLIGERDEEAEEAEEAKRNRVPSAPHTARVAELDKIIADLLDKIKRSTMRLKFRSLTAARFNEIASEHPNRGGGDAEAFNAWVNDVLDASFLACYQGDSEQKEEIASFGEIRPALSAGEYDLVGAKVLELNRRSVDVPKSSKRSGKTRR